MAKIKNKVDNSNAAVLLKVCALQIKFNEWGLLGIADFIEELLCEVPIEKIEGIVPKLNLYPYFCIIVPNMLVANK